MLVSFQLKLSVVLLHIVGKAAILRKQHINQFRR